MNVFLKNKNLLLLGAILLIAIVLRFYQLGISPSGFHEDEAAYGYNAYSIFKTGKDEYGMSLPIYLKSFGEYKPALYAYLSIPTIVLFDLTPFAVRIPAALFGVLSVLLLYLFTKKLTEDNRVAFLSSFLLAISPWHINLSRTVSEVVVSVFFILMMLYALLFITRGEAKIRWFMIAILGGFFAILTYTASTFFVVMLTVILFIGSFIKGGKKRFNKGLLVVLLVFISIGIFYNLIGSASRFKQVNIFQHPQTALILHEQIREDQYSLPMLTRFFHNKIINYSRTIAQNYNEYFTLDFLVMNGGFPHRQKVPDSGLFYGWEILFLFLGIYVIIKNNKKLGSFLFAWWLLLLLPSAVTFHEIPNVYRTLVVLPPMLIIIAFGMLYAFEQRKRLNKFAVKGVVCLLVIIAIWEFAYYGHQYYVHYEVHQQWFRGYAYKELIHRLNTDYDQYNRIQITKAHSSPYIYLLFYSKYDPALYQSLGSPRDVVDGEGFDKYTFTEKDCPLGGGKFGEQNVDGEIGVLYITRGDCKLPKYNSKLLKTIYWKDNNPAFQIVEYVSTASAKMKYKNTKF